ncbi:MAG: hypothetical protein ACMZ66_10935 [Thalassospira sp.]|uniref:hypothetical protein n=1 Tax=Thalassospira sp. TaxID=1912094 RepID=UPI003A845111
MSMPRRPKPSLVAAIGGIALLAGCNVALVEKPYYNVTETESFKTAGAPSRIMLIEVVDQENTFLAEFWAESLSNHGYPPRLRYVTDPTDVADNETIKPENRVVVVVSPAQTTMRDTLCTDPQSVGNDPTSDRVIVRFGFCNGDSIISETRARYNRDQFEAQIQSNADTINYQLFPRHLRNNDDRYCSPFLVSC